MKQVPLFAALLCLTSQTNAGIKKINVVGEKLSIDQVKQGSAADGTVNIDVVGRLQAGDLVSFILPTGKLALGKVTKASLVDNQKIHLIGVFIEPANAGFGFNFDINGTVEGALLFESSDEVYRLRFNPNNSKFNFIKDPFSKKKQS